MNKTQLDQFTTFTDIFGETDLIQFLIDDGKKFSN